MPSRRLSKRQIERIQAIQERRRERLATGAAALEEESDLDEAPGEEGRVVVRHGANLAVEDSDGVVHQCVARRHIGQPVCGDRVVWQRLADGRGLVSAILPRQSLLSRPDLSGRDKPLAANLTQLIILIAPEPEPGGYLIDQYLVAAETIGIGAVILGSKMDLLTAAARADFQQRFAHYAEIGYPCYWLSLRQPETLIALNTVLAGHTSILVGQSGVGKSSLVQALLPDRDIQIGRLSEATGLGRHTTSATTCYRLPGSGLLIDSPGVRSFRLGRIGREALEQGFRDFRPFLGHCRFANCHHGQEPGCAIRSAVATGQIHPERLQSFHQLALGCDTSTCNTGS